jgi:hypothetical protein
LILPLRDTVPPRLAFTLTRRGDGRTTRSGSAGGGGPVGCRVNGQPVKLEALTVKMQLSAACCHATVRHTRARWRCRSIGRYPGLASPGSRRSAAVRVGRGGRGGRWCDGGRQVDSQLSGLMQIWPLERQSWHVRRLWWTNFAALGGQRRAPWYCRSTTCASVNVA